MQERGALKSFNMIEGGCLKNMGAISRGLEIIWDENNFSSTPSPPPPPTYIMTGPLAILTGSSCKLITKKSPFTKLNSHKNNLSNGIAPLNMCTISFWFVL